MFAASAELDLGRLLLDLLIVLVAAKTAAEIAERIHVPAVLGEIVAGIVIGPSVLGLIELGGERGVSLAILAELGVLLLLLSVGMEMDLAELGKVGKASLLVAVIGVVLPFATGTFAGLAFGESTNTAIFFGAALTATSVGITARVFGDLRALATTEARVVLGAAVADDVLGLVILTVVVKIVTGGSVGVGTIVETLGLAILFLVGTGIVGLAFVPKVFDVINRRASSSTVLVVAAFALTLAFAALADLAKLAFIIGAFMAGLALGKSHQHERIASELGSVGNILIPVFFLQIGINADLGAMAKPSVLGLAAVMSVLAVLGKMAAALGARGVQADKWVIGLGMIPRGEVGLIFASIGLTTGVLDSDQYGALLIVVLVTTVITPPLLRARVGKMGTATSTARADVDEPEGGWLDASGQQLVLRGDPPAQVTVFLALTAAARAGTHRPADQLLNWFGQHRNDELTWDPDDTPLLVDMLRSHEPRGWRFLDVTGVLERTLPEVASAVARRRSDMSELDPLGFLRFPIVDRLNELAVHEPWLLDGEPSDTLMVAAFVADVTSDPSAALLLASRLARTAKAEEVAAIIADSRLLAAGANDPNGMDETQVLQLANHLADPGHAHNAYLLALVLGGLPQWQRDVLDERHQQIQEVFAHPELTSSEALNLAAARRSAAQRIATSESASERLRFASTAYLLSHDPEELARQAQLVEPLPLAGVVRVAISPEPEPDHWKIDIACRNTDGLLARITEVLVDHGLDVLSADIETWPDGAVLDSYVVRTADRPSPRTLGVAIEKRLRGQLHAMARPELVLTFDNDALPWHTVCIVTGPDQPGTLQAVATAFAATKVVVHTARVASDDGRVNDRFTVSDRLGRKLDAAAVDRVRKALAGTPRSMLRR